MIEHIEGDESQGFLCCIECMLRATADGRRYDPMIESVEAHMTRLHPDGGLQGAARAALEQQAMQRILQIAAGVRGQTDENAAKD